MKRICLNCEKETPDTPCPYCGGGNFQKIIREILPRPRKLLGSVEKNDIWREGYNKCLWDIEQNINKYYDKHKEI